MDDHPDVPDLIGALAERFQGNNIPVRQALAIAAEMLAVAMTEPDEYDLFLQTFETRH